MTISCTAHRRCALLAMLLVAACADSGSVSPDVAAVNARAGYEPGAGQRQYGAPVSLGDGKIRTYVVTDHRNKVPLEVGVAIDATVLTSSLPSEMAMLHVPLPPNMPAPYRFVMVDWNPNGHEPPGVYDLPHFDFHFYTTSEAEVMAIDPASPTFAQDAANMPDPALVPPFYALPPAPPVALVIPRMGIHWSDVRAPELQPPQSPQHEVFTRTFIYGSWNGRFTFLEPMITRAYLNALTGRERIAIPQSANMAAAFASNGWYPTHYSITFDAQAREYRIALDGLRALQR